MQEHKIIEITAESLMNKLFCNANTIYNYIWVYLIKDFCNTTSFFIIDFI